ncbi:hypothetical protein FKG94_19060 [Exilibacterium tricleocarpae]|uniref:SGNH/GDSL hydrolase family protein n=1 Tax=Exilibacterium tricleocarpae TaxID=2591008 RepID=A0A545T3G8_9GAMM|nr:hypothetical protein [Exilibacterium tricleocarpae]TQV71750.1 hypothetical protein FKG94_19060 [Exilibacterium tricleocarpae]
MKTIRTLQPILFILFWLLAAELVLEFRHYKKGFNTPIFGQAQGDNLQPATAPQHGPTPEFPFRSHFVNTEDATRPTVWFASASYAEHISFPVDSIFPTIACTLANCTPLNASRAGISIRQNIDDLQQFGQQFTPDFVILYQMSGDVLALQKLDASIDTGVPSPTSEQTSIIETIRNKLARFSSHIHLKEYLGGTIKLNGPLKASLSAHQISEFEKLVNTFVDRAEALQATPVLATFATMYSADNVHQMPYGIRTSFMRYGNKLSIEGWVNAISVLNDSLRKVAAQRNIPIVDLEPLMTGKTELFVDYVHFNKQGHQLIGRTLAQSLSLMERNDGI